MPIRNTISPSSSTSAVAIPVDTSADAHAVQCEIYRRLGGRGRLDVMFRLSETVRRLTLSGIRARHTDYTTDQVRQAYARLVLGDALASTIWPTRELVDP
jgi:hypothetical protein